jgi:CDP-glucose 4,6-dehydratase
MAEIAARSYAASFFPAGASAVRIVVARAGNVIGGGDWARERIVPDCVRAWSRGDAVLLRRSTATRPWQHVLEPLGGYLTLAARAENDDRLHAEAFNFGPSGASSRAVRDLVGELARHWEGASWRDAPADATAPHEAEHLRLDCAKAEARLGWRSTLDFAETVQMTAEWYRRFYRGDDMRLITRAQIREYAGRARARGQGWAEVA